MLYYADGVYFADQLNGISPASPGLYNQKTADCARIPRPAPASVCRARVPPPGASLSVSALQDHKNVD